MKCRRADKGSADTREPFSATLQWEENEVTELGTWQQGHRRVDVSGIQDAEWEKHGK